MHEVAEPEPDDELLLFEKQDWGNGSTVLHEGESEGTWVMCNEDALVEVER